MTPYFTSQDGTITIYHADARDVLPTLGAGTVALVLTDPPYSISVPGGKHVSRPGKGTRNLDFFAGDTDWAGMTAAALTVVKSGLALLTVAGSVYVWAGHRQFGALTELLELEGFSTRFLVWAKHCPPPPAPGSGWPSGAELCVYGYRPGRTWTHRGIDTPRSNVLTFDSYRHGQPGKVDHPTQKPLELFAPLVRASSRPGDLILDPFLGSGTTAVVAQMLGRRCIGCELEERYCEIAATRLQQQTLLLEEVPA